MKLLSSLFENIRAKNAFGFAKGTKRRIPPEIKAKLGPSREPEPGQNLSPLAPGERFLKKRPSWAS